MEKTYKLKWTKNAKEDLLCIIEYIKNDSLDIANNIYLKLKQKAHSSNFFPLKGRIVPELRDEGITQYREIIVSPWRIIYRVGDDTVYIMAIIDARQNLEELLFQKLLNNNINVMNYNTKKALKELEDREGNIASSVEELFDDVDS